jgi:hypothetical protein
VLDRVTVVDVPGRPLVRAIAVASAVMVVSLAFLSLLPPTPLHGDSARDLLLARDLAEGTAIHGAGAQAAFAQHLQGTSWIDLLALGRRLGLGVTGLQWLAYSTQALALALGVCGLARLLDRRPDDPGLLAGAALLLPLLPLLSEAPILWQPLLLPLPLMLAHLALWRLVVDGRALDAALLGLFVAWSIDVHIVAIVLVAPAALAIALASRRPGFAMLGAGLAGAGLLGWSSPTMLTHNLGLAQAHGHLVWAGAGVAIAGVVGLALRRRFAPLAGSRRLQAVAIAELLALIGLLGASTLPSTPDLSPRYLLPFAPVLLLLVGLRLDPARPIAGRRVRAGAAALAALLIGAHSLPSPPRSELPTRPSWTFIELERLATATAAHGYPWTALVERLQGPTREAVLGGLAALEQEPAAVATPTDEDLIFIGVPAAALAELDAVLEPGRVLARIDNSGGVGLLIRLPARVVRREPRVRWTGADAGPELDPSGSGWREVGLTPPADRAHLYFARAYPAAYELDGRRIRVDPRAGQIHWRLRFAAGPARVVSTIPGDPPSACAWRITRVELDSGGELGSPPAFSVTLPPDRPGWIELGRTLLADDGVERCALVQDDGVLPPGTLETAPEQARLRALLGLSEPE